jgi:hypothetical protein
MGLKFHSIHTALRRNLYAVSGDANAPIVRRTDFGNDEDLATSVDLRTLHGVSLFLA